MSDPVFHPKFSVKSAFDGNVIDVSDGRYATQKARSYPKSTGRCAVEQSMNPAAVPTIRNEVAAHNGAHPPQRQFRQAPTRLANLQATPTQGVRWQVPPVVPDKTIQAVDETASKADRDYWMSNNRVNANPRNRLLNQAVTADHSRHSSDGSHSHHSEQSPKHEEQHHSQHSNSRERRSPKREESHHSEHSDRSRSHHSEHSPKRSESPKHEEEHHSHHSQHSDRSRSPRRSESPKRSNSPKREGSHHSEPSDRSRSHHSNSREHRSSEEHHPAHLARPQDRAFFQRMGQREVDGQKSLRNKDRSDNFGMDANTFTVTVPAEALESGEFVLELPEQLEQEGIQVEEVRFGDLPIDTLRDVQGKEPLQLEVVDQNRRYWKGKNVVSNRFQVRAPAVAAPPPSKVRSSYAPKNN